MSIKNFLFIVACFCFSATSFGQQQEVVAQIGDRRITVKDFQEKYNQIKSTTSNWPTPEQFLEDLIRYEVGVLEAEKRNLQQDPQVQERFKQELYKALLEKELGKKAESISVSDSEMKSWYNSNPQIRLSQIVIELKFDASAEQRSEAQKRAEQIYEEVKSSKRPFEELVKLYSDDPLTKQVGGDMGWVTRVTVIPQIYDMANKMKVGEVRGLVRSPFGLHILKSTGRRTFQEADKRQIRMGVFEEKKLKMFNDFFTQLKKKYPIKSNPSLAK